MQNAKIVFVAAMSLFFLCSVSFGADIAKIGVIDFQKVFETSSAGKVAKAVITKQGKKMEENLKEKGAAITELRQRLERESLVMSKEMREEKEREFRIKINDLKSLEKRFKQELRTLNIKLSKRLKDATIDIVSEIGKKGGYLLIIEKTVVLYSPNAIDITDQLIQKYNTEFALKTEKEVETQKE